MIQKQDILYIILIAAIVTLLFICTSGSIASIYSDIGREYYIPWRMNSGDILYKDIFNVYAPLGYQISAVFLKLLGNKMSSLYIAGLIFSLVALSTVFLITKEYTSRIYAFFTTLFIIITCTFYQSISNWISPYSYSVLYSMTAFLLSLLMLIFFINSNKFKYFALSCFFIGFSIASKYEYSLFLLVLIFYVVKLNFNGKQILYSLLAFLSVPALSILILLIQGAGTNDFICALKNMKQLANTESLKYFYTYIGIFPSLESLERLNSFNKETLFSLFGIFSILITIFSFKTTDAKYKTLCASSVLASAKTLFYLPLNLYGTFFLPILFMVISVFVYRHKNDSIICILYNLFLILTIISYSYFDIEKCLKNRANQIIINGNKIYTDNYYFARRYNDITKYIAKSTNKDDKVLVLPEGAILNFLTQRISDNKYYYLIPPNVEIFKEEQIIKDLQNEAPKLIIIFTNKYYWYDTGSFENTYGQEIFNFVNENYNIDENYSGMYDKIYRLKEE